MGRLRKFNEYKILGIVTYILCKHGNVKIDTSLLEKVNKYTWFTKKDGSQRDYFYVYASVTENKRERKISLHRFIMKAKKDEFIDHINRDTLDNRLENLRICSRAENNRNAKKNKRGKVLYKGVSIRPSGRFAAYINFNKKCYCLGTYDTAEEAALQYNKKALELFKEYANLNIIKGEN